MENITVREWIKEFNAGEFKAKDVDTQVEAGWRDWFCSDEALARRLEKMGNIIKDIKSDFILDNYRVWFKNNCPVIYPKYDDFRFEPLDKSKRDQLYFGVRCGHPYGSKHVYEIFTARAGYTEEFKCKNKKEVLTAIERLAEDFQKDEELR